MSTYLQQLLRETADREHNEARRTTKAKKDKQREPGEHATNNRADLDRAALKQQGELVWRYLRQR